MKLVIKINCGDAQSLFAFNASILSAYRLFHCVTSLNELPLRGEVGAAVWLERERCEGVARWGVISVMIACEVGKGLNGEKLRKVLRYWQREFC